MAKEPAFPNLPEKKTCPVCKKEFPRPTRRGGREIDGREWHKRVYCSQKCSIDARRRSNDNLFK